MKVQFEVTSCSKCPMRCYSSPSKGNEYGWRYKRTRLQCKLSQDVEYDDISCEEDNLPIHEKCPLKLNSTFTIL